MFFILSKTLAFLIKPITLVLICFILGFFLKKPRWKKRFLVSGFVLLVIFTNDFLSNEFIRWWEVPVTPLEQLEGKYDVAIVLAGITETKMLPRDRVYFKKGADRVTHALQLYRQKKVKKILVSGGTGDPLDQSYREARELFKFLRLAGVPARDLMVEPHSRNTHESAIQTTKMLKSGIGKNKYLLITSAFHMRRALACFEKQGLPVIGYSTDFYSLERKHFIWVFFIPSDDALTRWTKLSKEIVGYTVYKMMGYI